MKTKFIIALIGLLLASAIHAQNETTKRVAILETVDKEGKVPYGIKLMVRSKLCDFITATPGYEGYDRIDVGSVLNEHEFQRSGLVSDKDIKRLGEMTGANYVLVTEAATLNSSYILLTAKILDVETARVEKAATVQSPTTVEGLDQNCKILSGKLLNINVETGALRGELMLNEGKYTGEYKNGKPHGKGKIIYSTDDKSKRKSYEGDWINGIREGSGTMVWNSGEKYVGNWENGLRNGYGTDYYTDGNIYEGNFKDDKRHGKGKMTYASDDKSKRKSYEGDWINGIREGSGTMVWNDGEKYVGNWKNGLRNGHGTDYYTNGKIYEGNFKDDKRHGKGKMTYASDDKSKRKSYEGDWINGVREGNGTLLWNDGDKYVGEFKDGQRNGKGTHYWADGNYEVTYYKDGAKDGLATYYYNNGQSYNKGYYENGKKEGKWEIYKNGRHTFTYTYKNGEITRKKSHK